MTDLTPVIATGAMILCGILAITMIFGLFKDAISYTSGRGSNIGGIISKVTMLILVVGVVFVAGQAMQKSKAKAASVSSETMVPVDTSVTEIVVASGENVQIVDKVTVYNTDPNTEYSITAEIVDATDPVMTVKELEKHWKKAIKEEYDFYYNNHKVSPAFIDYKNYTVNFDDDRKLVILTDK